MADVKEIAKNNRITNYVREVFHEMTKVTWPTKNQAVKLTIIVLSFCLVFAVFLTVADFVFGQGHNFLVQTAAKYAVQENSPTDFPVSTGSVQATTADGQPVTLPITTVPANK